MDEIQSKYGFTEVVDDDFADSAQEDNLYKKLMALYESFRDESAWIRGKWERNRRIFLCQGLGIPLSERPTADDFLAVPARREERKPTTSTPVLYSTYENLVSDAIEMQPEAVFLGRSADDGVMADNMTAIFRCLLERRNFKAIYADWVRIRSQYGMAVVETLWDEDLDSSGDVDLAVWSPMDIFFDPLCENIQDGRAVFKVTHRHASWFKEHYPEKIAKMAESEDLMSGTDQFNPEKISQTIPLIECWCRRYNTKKRKYAVHMIKMAGGVILENSEQVKATRNGMYSHGQYPFVVSYYEQIKGTPWGMGPMDYLAPVQEYISDMDDLILQNIKASAKPRIYCAKSAGVDPMKLANMDEQIIEVNNLDSVKWETGQPLNAAALQMYLSKTETLKTESGQNAASRGEVPGSVTAATAIQMLQSAGSKRANLSQYNLNNSFATVVRQLVSDMMQFYDKARVFRLRGALVESDQIYVFDPAQYKRNSHEWEYDLEVRIQRESTFQTAYTNQTILSFLQMGALDATDAITLLDIPNHDAVRLAVEKNNKIKQTLQSLMQEVQSLRAQVGSAAEENQKLMESAAQTDMNVPDSMEIQSDNPMFAQA